MEQVPAQTGAHPIEVQNSPRCPMLVQVAPIYVPGLVVSLLGPYLNIGVSWVESICQMSIKLSDLLIVHHQGDMSRLWDVRPVEDSKEHEYAWPDVSTPQQFNELLHLLY